MTKYLLPGSPEATANSLIMGECSEEISLQSCVVLSLSAIDCYDRLDLGTDKPLILSILNISILLSSSGNSIQGFKHKQMGCQPKFTQLILGRSKQKRVRVDHNCYCAFFQNQNLYARCFIQS